MDPTLLNPPEQFPSARLLLRSYRPEDAAVYFQAVRANWDHLYEFLPPMLEKARSASDVEGVIRWMNAEWELRNLFIFSVWDRAGGGYVGETYLANPDWRVPCIEMGYFVVKERVGQGFASEAARAVRDYAFRLLGVTRVELYCNADNTASMHVAERCGFTLEGRLRQRNKKKSGAVVDRLWYGLLKDEWLAITEQAERDRPAESG